MSVTLEDSSKSPWIEVGIARNYTPVEDKEIEEVRHIFRELAAEIASNKFCGKK